MHEPIRRRIIRATLLIGAVFVIGTAGFRYLLGLPFIEALYLTVITLTTVGYGDISPHADMPPGGNAYLVKLFTILLIIVGMGGFLYFLSIVTEYMVSGEMSRARRQGRMRRRIDGLRGHWILCGAGETALHMARELGNTARPFVLVDTDADRLRALADRLADLCYVHGDATQETTLARAGLERAAGVLLALPDDKDVLYALLALQERKRATGAVLRVAARTTDWQKTGPKLRAAGADVVIAPDGIAGRRMVSEMFRPSVTTFLDRMLRDTGTVLRVEEATVAPDSALCGVPLEQSRIRERTGLVIVAVRGPDGTFAYNPGPQQPLAPGDVLIAMGEMSQIVHLRRLAGAA